MRFENSFAFKGLCCLLTTFLYCEYLIYYVILAQCNWPSLYETYQPLNERPVHAMFFADTHLLGKRNGHWFDKLRREWQMHRAFQTAMKIFQPEVIFLLGDAFDEGLWCSGVEFNEYVDRFHSLFKVPQGTKLYVVAGNHDIGFHYSTTPYLADRFSRQMNASPVQMVSIRGNHFVLINSMAMEGDGCFLCHKAESMLNNITSVLRCMKGTSTKKCDHLFQLERYSRPILLQHFPLYRMSDEICMEPDAAPLPEKNNRFRERWDCLSRESTEFLVDNLQPRVALGGHTHHGCFVTHQIETPGPNAKKLFEYSVPSFSWRNRDNPSFMLGVFSPDKYIITKCYMPKESTVIHLYVLCGVGFIVLILMHFKSRGRSINPIRKQNYH